MLSLRIGAIALALAVSSAAQAQTKTYVTTIAKDGRSSTTTGPNGTWTRQVTKGPTARARHVDLPGEPARPSADGRGRLQADGALGRSRSRLSDAAGVNWA
jgi:hypothetical protein